jgi:hypothetical protein
MDRSLRRLVLACALAFGTSASAFAQGSANSSLAGVLADDLEGELITQSAVFSRQSTVMSRQS